MSISTILYTLLSEDATLTGIVGAKIYPQQAPQTASFPFVVFSTISTQPNNTKGSNGESTMDKVRVQVTSISTSQTQLDSIGQAIRAKLDYIWQQNVGSTYVQTITFQSENDAFDENAGQDGAYLKYQDFFIHYNR